MTFKVTNSWAFCYVYVLVTTQRTTVVLERTGSVVYVVTDVARLDVHSDCSLMSILTH